MKHTKVSLVVETLMEGRERIAKGWIRGAYMSNDGTRYCALGALGKIGASAKIGAIAYWSPGGREAVRALERAVPEGYDGNVAVYNDERGRTQEDILALYDRAIAQEMGS